MQALNSKWDGMSRHLIASLYEVNYRDEAVGDIEVHAPFVEDVQLELEMNWQSPFEGSGAEGAAPALSAMMQSGALAPIVDKTGEMIGRSLSGLSSTLGDAVGRSGMTKLNSTQIFNGMPPIRIQGDLLFRAWSDPQSEVETPIDQLLRWALPAHLAPEGTMMSSAIDYLTKEGQTLVETAFPSLVPAMLALTYKGRTYSPMVLERVSLPLGSPIDRDGNFTTMKVGVTLATLTGWDRSDWVDSKL